MTAINLYKLITALSHDRYMGAVIYGEAGVGKTEYLRKFQRVFPDLKVFYLDVQQTIQEQGNPQIVFDLTPQKFLEWGLAFIPKEELKSLNAVFFDNFDVLVNLWDSQEKEEFLTRLQRLERVVFPKPVVAMVQEDGVFQQAYQQQENSNLRRIIRFRELEAV